MVYVINRLSTRSIAIKCTIPLVFTDDYSVGMVNHSIIFRLNDDNNVYYMKHKSSDKLLNLASGKYGLRKHHMYYDYTHVVIDAMEFVIPCRIISIPSIKARRRIVIKHLLDDGKD